MTSAFVTEAFAAVQPLRNTAQTLEDTARALDNCQKENMVLKAKAEGISARAKAFPVSVDRLVQTLLPWRWQRECEIRFDTRDEKTIVVVRHLSNRYLRHSKGPHTGVMWDIYGDDFLTPELALCELAKAPPPESIPAKDSL